MKNTRNNEDNLH